jgi:diguanylate cyclase (GGDEF)-like protein
MSDGFVLLDMNNCFIEANSKAKRIFPQLTLTSPGTKVHDIAGIFRPNAKGSVSKNEFITVKHKDSQKHYQLSQTNIMSGNRIIARCVMIYDATETKRLLDDVSALAERDTLTGLSNRRTLYQRWENLYPHLIIYDSLCLLMLDVDFFKRVNDIHGHLKGDEVLKTIAEQLSSRFRKSDTVARYGGEEFCILLPDVQLKTAITLIRGLKDDIAKHTYHSSRGDFTVTISIGVTSFDRSRHSSLNAMIADADAALYAAKNSGRNTIYFARSTCEKVSSDADDLVLECVLNTFPAGIDDV